MAKTNPSDTRPSDEEISQRAYELYLQRGSVPGHETDDWLQAEAELIEARRNAEDAFAPSQAPGAGTPPPEQPRKGNGRRESPSSTRRPLRQ
jgi:hypothetical protein